MKNRFDRVYIEITNICNFKCPFCSGVGHEKKQMSVADFKKVAKSVRDYTDEVCLHVLGEPLLHEEFETILKVCQDYNLRVFLVTNGYFLKTKVSILLKYVNIFKKINISLHSYVYNIHDRKEKLNEIMEVSKQLAEAGVTIELRNILSVYDKDFCNDLMISVKESFNVELFNLNENKNLQPRVYYVVKKPFDWPDKTINADKKIDSFKRIYCLGGRSHIAVLSNLDVVPCCLDTSAQLSLGNLREESLDVILASERFEKLYHSFGNGKANETFCQTCQYNKNIKG